MTGPVSVRRRRRRARVRTLYAAAALVALGGATTPPAAAAPPTQVRDVTTSVLCSGASGGRIVEVHAAASELAGSEAFARLYDAQGKRAGEGVGTSAWTDSTFRTSLQVLDDAGTPVAEASLAGSYRTNDDGERVVNRFADGNVRVVEDHTYSTLSVTDVVLELDGTMVTDLECVTSRVEGHLFFTNPAAHVRAASDLVFDGCALQNAQAPVFEGRLEELFVGFEYADAPAVTAGGVLDLSSGSWSGTFRLTNDEGPMGQVPAQATLTRVGAPVRLVDRQPRLGERLVLTPYDLVVDVDGPASPAQLRCRVIQVDSRLRHVTPGGPPR